MKRSIKSIESEIIHQIIISELWFNICNSIEIIPGRGNDFLPYYYNLNFTRGLISLHSLLLSKLKNELSISNYIKLYESIYWKEWIKEFKSKIEDISTIFEDSFPLPLRHKIAAHIDESFKHTDFTSAYVMPSLIEIYIEIVSKLKERFFEFTNYSRSDNPFYKIKEQSDSIIKYLK